MCYNSPVFPMPSLRSVRRPHHTLLQGVKFSAFMESFCYAVGVPEGREQEVSFFFDGTKLAPDRTPEVRGYPGAIKTGSQAQLSVIDLAQDGGVNERLPSAAPSKAQRPIETGVYKVDDRVESDLASCFLPVPIIAAYSGFRKRGTSA